MGTGGVLFLQGPIYGLSNNRVSIYGVTDDIPVNFEVQAISRDGVDCDTNINNNTFDLLPVAEIGRLDQLYPGDYIVEPGP